MPLIGFRMKRKKIGQETRNKILSSVANCCCLCGQYLFTYHIHHIEFLADGGANYIDNLVALCPTCHYGLAHSRRAQYKKEIICSRRDQLRRLVAIERRILNYINRGYILEAGKNFARTDYFNLVILFGRYRTAIEIGNTILAKINPDSLHNQLVLLVLLELSMYTQEERKYAAKVERQLKDSSLRAASIDYKTRAHISISRAYGRSSMSYERQKWLLTANPSESLEPLVMYREAEYQRRDGNSASAIATIDSVLKKIAVQDHSITLVSPALLLKGHALAERGDREEARSCYEEAFDLSMEIGATRSIFLSALHLASNALTDDIDEAKHYFSLASPYEHTKRNSDTIYENILIELIRREK